MLSNLCYFNKINLKHKHKQCNLKTEVNKVKVMYRNKTQVLNNNTSVNLFTLNFEKRN